MLWNALYNSQHLKCKEMDNISCVMYIKTSAEEYTCAVNYAYYYKQSYKKLGHASMSLWHPISSYIAIYLLTLKIFFNSHKILKFTTALITKQMLFSFVQFQLCCRKSGDKVLWPRNTSLTIIYILEL